MNTEESKTEAEVVAELQRKALEFKIERVQRGVKGSALVAAVPNNGRIELHSLKKFLDEAQDYPDRRAGVSKHTNAESFIAHVLRHKGENTVLFASKSEIRAIYDYHLAGSAEEAASDEMTLARRGAHVAVYELGYSEEWRAWSGKFNVSLSQEQFAEFLEERADDIISPDNVAGIEYAEAFKKRFTAASSERLVDLASNLKINIEAKVRNNKSLRDGSGVISYEERHKDERGDEVKVPGGFFVAVPIFTPSLDESGKPVGALDLFPVQLRYRVNNGGAVWMMIPHRKEMILQLALNNVITAVQKKTEVQLFHGQPEGAGH